MTAKTMFRLLAATTALFLLAAAARADDIEVLPLAPPGETLAVPTPAPETERTPSGVDDVVNAPVPPALKAGPDCDWSADAEICRRAWEEAEAARRARHEARPKPKPKVPSQAEAIVDDLPVPVARGEKPGATVDWKRGGPRLGWKWHLD